jgi:hypothetical protein
VLGLVAREKGLNSQDNVSIVFDKKFTIDRIIKKALKKKSNLDVRNKIQLKKRRGERERGREKRER